MKKKRLLWGAALFLALSLILLTAVTMVAPVAHADPGETSSPHYKITWDVMAYGSNLLSSTHYKMDSTIGQTAVIPMHSTHYRLQNGYWGGWWPTMKTFLPNFLRKH